MDAEYKAALLVMCFYAESLGVSSKRYIPVAFLLAVWRCTGRESLALTNFKMLRLGGKVR